MVIQIKNPQVKQNHNYTDKQNNVEKPMFLIESHNRRENNSICITCEVPMKDLRVIHWTIDLFHSNCFPSGEQPEHRKLAHEL